MVTESMTREEAQARARVRALQEGVRVHLVSREADVLVFTCASSTQLNLTYTITLRNPETEVGQWLEKADRCSCMAGTFNVPCKHIAACWLMAEAILDLEEIQAAAVKQAEAALPPVSSKVEQEINDLF